MTIFTTPERQAELRAEGTANNPFVLWNNRLRAATAVTENAVSTFPASNLATGTTYDFARAEYSATSAAAFAIEPGTATPLQTLAIAGHNFHEHPGLVLRMIRSGPGLVTSEHTIPVADASPIVFRDTVAPLAYARYAFDLTATDTAIPPRASVLFAGPELVLPQRLYQGYAPPFTPNAVDIQSNVSEGANLLGSRVVQRGSTATARIDHLNPSFVRSDAWAGFQRHFNDGRGFFWAWRPESYPEDVQYAWREGDALLPDITGPAAFTGIRMSMRFFEGAT